jgi:hypothetical protein
MTMALDTRNPAYATEEQARQVAGQMAKIAEAGWTRPDVLAAFGKLEIVGVTDSVVYRAQREKVHTRELPIFEALFAAIEAGTVQPRVKSRKLKVADVADKAYAAAKVLAELGDNPKAADLKAAFEALKGILPEPKADEPEVPAEGDATKGEQTEGDNPEA